jgi:hypothetical protein
MAGLKFPDCEYEIEEIVTKTTLHIQAEVFEIGGDAPTNIIGTDQEWQVVVRWGVHGRMVSHLCGKWAVGLSLESIGKANEYDFGPAFVDMDPCGNGHYSYTFNIKKNEVSADVDGTIYNLGVTLTARDACGKPSHIAAFCHDVSLMMFQQAPHSP